MPGRRSCRTRQLYDLEAALPDDEWEFLNFARRSEAYSFLKDPAENIYTIEDGEPLELLESS